MLKWKLIIARNIYFFILWMIICPRLKVSCRGENDCLSIRQKLPSHLKNMAGLIMLPLQTLNAINSVSLKIKTRLLWLFLCFVSFLMLLQPMKLLLLYCNRNHKWFVGGAQQGSASRLSEKNKIKRRRWNVPDHAKQKGKKRYISYSE